MVRSYKEKCLCKERVPTKFTNYYNEPKFPNAISFKERES